MTRIVDPPPGRAHPAVVRYIALTIHGNYLRCGRKGVGFFPTLWADGTGLGDETIFERIEVAPGRVVLHPLSGGYLQVLPDDSLAVNMDGYEVWETFDEIEWPSDQFSLRTWQRKFLCAEGGGGREVVANRTEAGEWEKFYYEVPPPALLPPEPEAQRPGVDETVERGPRKSVREGMTGGNDRVRDGLDRNPFGP